LFEDISDIIFAYHALAVQYPLLVEAELDVELLLQLLLDKISTVTLWLVVLLISLDVITTHFDSAVIFPSDDTMRWITTLERIMTRVLHVNS